MITVRQSRYIYQIEAQILNGPSGFIWVAQKLIKVRIYFYNSCFPEVILDRGIQFWVYLLKH